jgi:hypothetical protein
MKTSFVEKRSHGLTLSCCNGLVARRVRAVLRCWPLLGLLLWASPPAQAQPANDLFSAAQLISGAEGSTDGSTIGAAKEFGEPNHAGNSGGRSVWYVWEAPQAGVATFQTFGSQFDTLLAAYTGTNVAALTVLAGNDDNAGTFQSRVQFVVAEGGTYYIAVDGYAGDAGNLLLAWSMGELPLNDNFASAQVIAGTVGSVPGSTGGATKESAEPNHAGSVGGHSIWYCWTSPVTGLAAFSTVESEFDTLLAVYTGASVDELSLVADNDDIAFPDILQSRVTFGATMGERYWIAIDGYAPFGRAAFGVTGPTLLNWGAGPPPNDNFEQATVISGPCGITNGANFNGTKETGEPSHAGNLGGASIWYAWTAAADGLVAVSTAGSQIDTVLAVYTGPSVGLLTLVGQNNDSSGTLQSRTNFNATAGVTYFFAIDGYGGDDGLTRLSWSTGVPPNNEFFSAQPISGLSGALKGTTFFATKDIGEPDHAGNPGGHSIWYEWTPPQSGVGTVSLAGSTFNTLLAVYTGGSVDALTPIASNNDSAGTLQSRVSFVAGAGVSYFIAVDGFGGAEGLVLLSYQLAPPPVLHITPSANNVIINWAGPYRLESTTALANPSSATVWTPVVGTAPVTVATGGSGQTFFRAVFP